MRNNLICCLRNFVSIWFVWRFLYRRINDPMFPLSYHCHRTSVKIFHYRKAIPRCQCISAAVHDKLMGTLIFWPYSSSFTKPISIIFELVFYHKNNFITKIVPFRYFLLAIGKIRMYPTNPMNTKIMSTSLPFHLAFHPTFHML